MSFYLALIVKPFAFWVLHCIATKIAKKILASINNHKIRKFLLTNVY